MSYLMQVTVDCVLAAGKTEADFRAAMAVFYEQLKVGTTSEPDCTCTRSDGKWRMQFYGQASEQVRWGVVLRRCARNLGLIVAVGGHILLQDLDSGGEDVCSRFWFGPDAEAVRLARIDVALDRLREILAEVPPETVGDIRQLLLRRLPVSVA